MADPPPGCAFGPRCKLFEPACAEAVPGEVTVAPGHWARCQLLEGVAA
jgi:peptide/nickel transport system ATP-binding protein